MSAPNVLEGPQRHLVRPEMLIATAKMTDVVAPAFRAQATDDSYYDIAELTGDGPVVLVFMDSGEKFTSDLPYKQPESTKSSGQRELQAQACENMLRTRSAISNNLGAREVIPSTSVGWIFVTKESPSP